METKRIDDGGAAFPRPASEFTANGTLSDGNRAEESQDGMSLRDYFAARAMSLIRGGWMSDSSAEACYEMADDMIAARKPQPAKAE